MHRIEEVTVEGVPGLALHSPEGLSATFVPGAGMIGTSLRFEGAELLGQGEGLAAYRTRGRWFGIPLLHPWANRLRRNGLRFENVDVTFPVDAPGLRRDGSGLPIHGLVSGCPDWQVSGRDADGAGARFSAALDFGADLQRLSLFPFPHRLEVSVALCGQSLTIETVLEASGALPVPVAFGWHPYFQLPGIPREIWSVTLPVRTRAVLDDRCLPTGRVEPLRIPPGPLGGRTYDDLFPEREPGRPFVLEGGERRIEVEFGAGYEVAVVYAPANADVVCFEPMTAPTDPFDGDGALRVATPDAPFRAAFEIRVR